MLSEYEERLELKRLEVSRLQQQRDKLLATQKKLQELQQNVSTLRNNPYVGFMVKCIQLWDVIDCGVS